MPYLAETTILLRWIEPGTPLYEQALSVLEEAHAFVANEDARLRVG